MSDLISRLSLKDRASEYALSADEYKRLCKIIDTEPTAYDIDKVVKEIKTLKEEALGEYNMGEYNLDNNIGNSISENYRKDMNEGRCFAYDDAIEIVEQGSDANDVCECRKLKDYKSLFKTSCGYIFARKGFKYCPYCGNRIKVAE